MKKRFLFLCLIVAVCLCALGAAAEGVGGYELFAVSMQGYTMVPEALGMTSAIGLTEDGHGFITMNDESTDIASWTLEGETFSLLLTDGSSSGGVLRNGVVELDLNGDGEIILYYATPEADTSAYAVLSVEEFWAQYAADQAASLPDSRLYALARGMDSSAGVRLVYSVHQDYMDADQRYTVQGRGAMSYSRRVTSALGVEGGLTELFLDGTAYHLDSEAGTAKKVTSVEPGIIQDALMMNSLYSAILQNAARTDYTEETREVDGRSYAVEVYPAPNEYQAACAFYFDEAGRLAYCEEKHPDSAVQLGTSFYTVEAIDGEVDDALFSLEGYTVTE